MSSECLQCPTERHSITLMHSLQHKRSVYMERPAGVKTTEFDSQGLKNLHPKFTTRTHRKCVEMVARNISGKAWPLPLAQSEGVAKNNTRRQNRYKLPGNHDGSKYQSTKAPYGVDYQQLSCSSTSGSNVRPKTQPKETLMQRGWVLA